MGQVFEVERVRVLRDKTEVETVYGITSLSRDRSNAAVHLLEGVEASSKAAATRRFAVHPEEALPLLFT